MFPIIFETQIFTLYTFWLFFTVSIFVSTIILIKLSIRNRLKIQFISEHGWKLIFFFIIGARIASVLGNLNIYFPEFNSENLIRIFYIWDGGLSIWGGILAAGLYFHSACKKNEQDFWKWMDVFIPALLIGFAIGHLGAFFDGMNYGKETTLKWGVNFENPSIKYAVPIHPTQTYAFLYSLGIYGLLTILNHNEKIRNLEKSGFIGLTGVGLYSLFRFLEGFFRGDDTIFVLGARLPQVISLIIFIATSVFLYLRYNKPAKPRLNKH